MNDLNLPAYMPNFTEIYEYSQKKSGPGTIEDAFKLIKSIKYRMYLASFIRNKYKPVTRTSYDVEDLLFDNFDPMSLGGALPVFFHDLRKLNTVAVRAVYESIGNKSAAFENFISAKIGIHPPDPEYLNIETYAVDKQLIGWNVITGGVPLIKIPNPCVVQELISSICLSKGFRPKRKLVYYFFFDDFNGFFVEFKTEAERNSFIELCKCEGRSITCVW